MRILYLSYYFPPFNTIAAVRNGKIAKYLTQFGHEVRVISRQGQPFSRTLELEIPKAHVNYTGGFNLKKPMAWGQGIITKGPSPETLSSLAEPKLSLKRKIAKLYMNLLLFPDEEVGWYPFAYRAGRRLIETWKPDIILSSFRPRTPLALAARLSKKYRIPWVADMHDLWIGNPALNVPPWRHRREKRLERKILATAAGLVCVNEDWTRTLGLRTGKPAEVVANGFDPEDFPRNPEGPKRDGIVRIAHMGTMYRGKRDPSPLFEALRSLGEEAEKIRLLFYASDTEVLRKRIARFRVEPWVEVHEPVSHRESLRLQQNSDVLLILFFSDLIHESPAKLYEYLAARRPILAIGNSDRVLGKELRDRKAGMTLNDPEEIASQLSLWIKQKNNDGGIPALSPEACMGFTRKEQSRRLEKFLVKILAANRKNME